MAQGKEVRVLGKAVHHGEDHALAVHLGKAFNKVDRNVRPDLCGDIERLQEPGRVQGLHFVLLACWAGADEVPDHDAVVIHGEVAA